MLLLEFDLAEKLISVAWPIWNFLLEIMPHLPEIYWVEVP